jgi:hypothetical protein
MGGAMTEWPNHPAILRTPDHHLVAATPRKSLHVPGPTAAA